MQSRTLKSDLILLLAALIWGFAFVAQRQGMQFVGPFTYNAIRFALGALVLLPLWSRRARQADFVVEKHPHLVRFGGLILGVILFLGSSLQQIGIVYTTAGKAGFITGLYVVLVPFAGRFLGQKTTLEHGLAVLSTTVGLYFLTVTESFSIAKGDLYVLASAFFWTGHVAFVSWLSPRASAIRIAVTQFLVCAFLSAVVALTTESLALTALRGAALPILYGGIMSVGVAFSLQLYGQRFAPAVHAAIILSMETVFAALGGRLILGEQLSPRNLFGAGLMLLGMLLAQVRIFKRRD
ncbi:MAG: DMT family transporter [candidate division KSB1 bacterium]|nr:DMT family transporter [candidate division KSB1 bacterium]